MKALLTQLAHLFNSNQVHWGLGGSGLLALYNITDQVNDLDILVSLEDHERVCDLLSNLGKSIAIPHKPEYRTRKFRRFELNGIEIDLMSDFKIQYDQGIFDFILDTHQRLPLMVESTPIPVTSLEQWLLAYHLMVNRQEKVAMLEDYFLKSGDLEVALLKSYMMPTFPQSITKQVNHFLKNFEATRRSHGLTT